MNSKKIVLFVFTLVYLSFSLCKAQAVDPQLTWQVLETDHFKVVYDSKHRLLAEKYALFSEQAYATLVPLFKEAPSKTTLVLNDNTDSANGFSTDVPYPLIELYPVLPGSLDTIGDYGNWGLELVTHEFTHTLNMEPTHGLLKPFRILFGSIVRPNMLLPRWYLEGLAVQMETQYSNYGRLRSANYLAIARAMVEQGTLRNEDISRINESTIPDWPGGARPYLLGALVWNELIKMKGEEVVYTLNDRYSRRVPFTINGPLIDIAQMDYPLLLSKTYSTTEQNSEKQINLVKTAGESPYQKFKQDGQFNHSPAISPDGKKLLYIATNYRNDEVVRYVERLQDESFSNLNSKDLAKGSEIQRASWFPDSQSFVFDKSDDFDRYYDFSDLYRYDFSTKKSKQITKGFRAKEPVVSPDGQRVFFVQNTPTNTRLCSINKDGDDFKVHYEPVFQSRAARPEFLNEKEIIFTEKTGEGAEYLTVLDLATEKTKRVLPELAPVHFPKLTSLGLTFVSDKSGVANIYLANSDLTLAHPVTNSTTRAITAEYDSQAKEFIYSRLFSEGPQLVRMSLSESEKVPQTLPQVGPLVDYQWPHHTPPEVNSKFEEKDYSALPYLIPRYWMPWVYLSSTSNFFSASTSASDPLMKHSYTVTAYYDSYPDRPGFEGSYINQTIKYTFLELEGADQWDRLTLQTLRHNTAGIASIAAYIPGLPKEWKAGLGWRYDQTAIEGLDTEVRNGPQIFFSYKNYSQKGPEISPESGGAMKASYTKFLSGLGNTSYDRIDANGRYYLSKWLPDRHVLAPSIRATVEPGLSDLLLGPSSTSNGQLESTLNARHLVRGYNEGVFIGKNMLSASLEYRFPISYPYKGFGTTPFFIKRWHGALLTDALTVDGVYYDNQANAYYHTRIGGRMFMSAGGELRADATIGYHLPITFAFGVYYPFDQDAGTRSPVPFLGFQM